MTGSWEIKKDKVILRTASNEEFATWTVDKNTSCLRTRKGLLFTRLCHLAVSYTHLDVYKGQEQRRKRKGHRMALVVVVRKMTHQGEEVAWAQWYCRAPFRPSTSLLRPGPNGCSTNFPLHPPRCRIGRSRGGEERYTG